MAKPGLPPIKYVQIQTTSRCNADCVFCLAGETEVITPNGDKAIRDLVGRSTLLVPTDNHGTYSGAGVWTEVDVRSFGAQPLVSLRLRRGRSEKTLRVTKDHRWRLLRANSFVTTSQLAVGDRLASCYRSSLRCTAHEIRPSAVGIAQGFTFGDGSRCDGDCRPASARFYGEKEDMRGYFATSYQTQLMANRRLTWEARDLPRSWKSLPDIEESRSFLLGWLAGYFAADGELDKKGWQAVLGSSTEENVKFVKAVCYQLGVRVSPLRRKWREGFGQMSWYYSVSIAVADLPMSFWVRDMHKSRVTEREAKEMHWKVISVEDTGETEEVFCATVPGAESFALADNLLTGNCPYSEGVGASSPGNMSDEMFDKVLRDLQPFSAGINKGKVAMYLMAEPLLDKKLPERILRVHETFKTTEVEISTNGAAMTPKAADRLCEIWAGTGRNHALWYSHHGVDKESMEFIMAIDYEKATNNLFYLLRKSDGRLNIRIRGAGESRDGKQVYFTRDQYREFWRKRFEEENLNTTNVDIEAFTYHSRANQIYRLDRDAYKLNVGKVRDIGPGHKPFHCPRITEWVHIGWNGDLFLCCMDYHKTVKLPSLKDMSLVEYFGSEAYSDLVATVTGKKASHPNFICAMCQSPGG